MKLLRFARFFAVLLALVAPAAIFASEKDELQIGDQHDMSVHSKYKGWTSFGGGLLKDNHNLAYKRFHKGARTVIAITKPITRTPRGGFGKEQIIHLKEVKVPRGKNVTEENCGLLGYSPAIVYLNNDTNIATGYFALPGGIEVWQWVVNWEYCGVP